MKTRYQKLDNKLNKLTKTQHTEPTKKHTFHPTVINNTKIQFTNEEIKLLEKGPKYNMDTKKKDWVKNLALERETAISMLPTADRDTCRKLAAERIDNLLHKATTKEHNAHKLKLKQPIP
jgi:hypothetical protein